MPETSEMFFPPRAARGTLDFVVSDFPFPLALTYARLHEEMDRQEPIAAAWQLRDAFECLLKFTACVAIADYLHARPEPVQAGELVGLLLKPQGLSLGDWHTLLELALKPLEPFARADRLADSGRGVPALFSVFFECSGRLRPSPLNRQIDGRPESFVAWRNRVFGHGVFQQDRQWYANETARWLPTLHAFYTALHPVLAGWMLVSVTPGGDTVHWQGAGDRVPIAPHAHEPWGEPLSMLLTQSSGPHPRQVSFGPLLSVQECALCQQPAAFFFDRHRYEREKDRHRTFCLEYWRGHHSER